MRNTILTMFTAMLLPIAASAQFYTITKETEVQLPPVMNSTISADNKGETSVNCTETIGKDTVTVPKDGQAVNAPKARKGDKMELIIQKAVELGAYEVVPMATHRAVVKLDQKKEESKRKRWNAIAESAAKQSKRTVIPEVTKVFSFREAVIYAVETYDVCLIPYECAEGMEQTRAILAKVQPGTSVAILIGPEGGFEESEIAYAQEKGVHPITLGHRILRTETAGLAVLSALMLQLDLD